MAHIYVAIRGQPTGPLTEEEVRARLARNELQSTDLYWSEGMPNWIPLGQWLGWGPPLSPGMPPPLQPYFADAPPVTQYGGFWIRVGATLLDGLVLGMFVGTPLNIIMQLNMPPPPRNVQDPKAMLAYLLSVLPLMGGYMLISFVAQWLYFAIMESSSRQATLGKMACGLMITDLEGRRISFGKATARYFAKHIVSNFLTLGIGDMMCGWTEKNRCLHDMMVGTVVIRQKQKN